jgi:hypothetical protein
MKWFVYLPAFAILAGLSASAFASSDSSEVPNPFTDQPRTSSNVTSVDKGVGDVDNPAQKPLPSRRRRRR